MKSGELSGSSLHRTLIRGVEFMVRRLAEVADRSAEAQDCIRQVELQVKSGQISGASEIASAIRRQIVDRNPAKTVVNPVLPETPVPTAITVALGGVSKLERAAATMYYVESLDENAICSRLSMAPEKLSNTLGKLRASYRRLPIASNTDSAFVAI